MALFCETCNIGVSSEITMRDHVKGRRHQQAVAAVEKRKAAARCSLYCRDFPPSTTAAALRQYFSQFGNISRVMLEKERGCYCILHFDNEAAVQRALAYTNHRLGGYRLTVRPRKPITATPGHGQRADPRTHYQKVKAAAMEEEVVKLAEHEQLIQMLLQRNSFLDQMEVLYQHLALSSEDVQRRHEVCQYLHRTLLPFFPTCTFHQFGSSVNGFGMHGCDMDVFVDFHDDEIPPEAEEELRQKFRPVHLPYIRDIHSLNTTTGPLLPSQLHEISLMDRVRLLSRILTYHGQSCGDVTYIPSTRCPIARFVHIPTGIKCDMSVNNRLGLMNTRLLRMFAEDQRVRLLVFAVRYWGRWRQVAGNVASGPRLSNYCLSLLVYFYLANTAPPVLPTVQQLAEMAAEQKTIEGWDCSLPSLLSPTLNTQTADELLRGFFQFFSEIDLSAYVLLMRTATTLPLQQLLANREHDPVLKDFKIKAMAVQDPFVLSHNIALNVNGHTKDLLAHEIRVAVDKTSSWSLPDSSSAPGTSSTLWGLPYLFSSQDCQVMTTPPTPSTFTTATTAATTAANQLLQQASFIARSKQQTCLLSLDLSTVSVQVFNTLQASGDYKAAWYGKVRRLLLVTLRDVFLFHVQTESWYVITDNNLKIKNFQQESEEASVSDEAGGKNCTRNSATKDRIKDQWSGGSDSDTSSGLDGNTSVAEGGLMHGAAMASSACLLKRFSDVPKSSQNSHPLRSSEASSSHQNTPLSQQTASQVSSSHSKLPANMNTSTSLLRFPSVVRTDRSWQMPASSDSSFSENSLSSSVTPTSSSHRSPDHKAKRQRGMSDCVSAFSGSKRIRCGDGKEAWGVENYASSMSPDRPLHRRRSPSVQRNQQGGSMANQKATSSSDSPGMSSVVESTIADDSLSFTKMLKTSLEETSVCAPTSSSLLVAPMDVLSLHMNPATSISLPFQCNKDFPASGSAISVTGPATEQLMPPISKTVTEPQAGTLDEVVCLRATTTNGGVSVSSAAYVSSSQAWHEGAPDCIKDGTVIELSCESQPSSSTSCIAPSFIRNTDIPFTEESSQESTSASLGASSFETNECTSSSLAYVVEPCHLNSCKPVLLQCKGHCRTWNSRKALRSQLLQQGHSDDLDLEKLISKKIYQRDSGSSLEPIVFRCELSMVPHPDKAEAEVCFESLTPLKEFQVFVTFFKSFFPKIVSRNMVL